MAMALDFYIRAAANDFISGIKTLIPLHPPNIEEHKFHANPLVQNIGLSWPKNNEASDKSLGKNYNLFFRFCKLGQEIIHLYVFTVN